MMANNGVFVERREHERLAVHGNLVVSMRNGLRNKVGPVMDVCAGGLAFRYMDNSTLGEGPFELDIKVGGTGVGLKNIPVRLVSETRSNNQLAAGLSPIKRCSIQFGEISPDQKSQLDLLFQFHTR